MADYEEEQLAIPEEEGESYTPPPPPASGPPISSNNTAIPETEDESAGLRTSQRPPQPGQTPTSGLLADAQDTPPVQGIRKLVSYLMGAGSTQPQEAQRVVNEVKQENPGLSDDDANLLAVHQAGQMGGPAAAWGMVQYNRTAYNAKQSFAKAALNGIDGKAGDLSAAATAATQAGTHILDGSSVVFTAAPEGITATVMDPNTRQRQQYRLTPQQFNDYLDVGKVGQWDKVMAEGIGGALAKVSQGGGNAAQAAGPQAPQEAAQPQSKGFKTNYGTTPSTIDLSNGEGRAPNPGEGDTGYGSELENRSRAAYPWISQEGQRQQFMASQENTQAERENKLGIAQAGNEAKERVAGIAAGARTKSAETRAGGEVAKQGIRTEGNKDVARIQADARAKSEQQKALAALQKMEGQRSDAQMRERGRMARAEISNPNFLLQTEDARNKILQKYGIDPASLGGAAPTGQAAPAPTGQPAPQQQSARPQGVPAGAKQYQGKWYTRGPSGEAVLVPGQ